MAKDVAKWFGIQDIAWGSGSSGLALRSEDVARPLQSSDPVMFQVLEKLTSQVLKTTSPKKGVTALVHAALREAIHQRVPEARQVAKALALSEPSLQRALQEEGSSYRALVDQVRRELAREQAARGVPLDESAEKLGYSDVDSLRRAMSRWEAEEQ